MENLQPILVFYVDSAVFSEPTIINQFRESVLAALNEKNYNTLCFFMPTNGEERIECINPVLLTDPMYVEEYQKMKGMLRELEKRLDMVE